MIRKLLAVSLLTLASGQLLAAECKATVDSNDMMQFTSKSIDVDKSCKTFTVELKHVGTLPKNVMGHNLVLSKAADVQGIATDGMGAGVDKDYLKEGDARIIAHTKLIGGGETTSLTFDATKLDAAEKYKFFCSFPGHVAMMQGDLILK
ncbi:azurin [Pseudomonas sp. 21LCFQ02]|uniref:azurin n=1 Tax=unclassified Pseudomonas TaxID=196821 RepID=UPI0004F602EC|nr:MULTISPECIES: azurin [unclassified Pseudomonas]MCO8162734.1 azurin [Pseudomonas sp. 21LCFQ010]MCO8167788.1 azurin [Pseudomonas sp. 21LCFQ02]MCQ9424714.1 azurin [Pseudomonas sp. LJDD11]BAP43086.1 azurin [Pseudomonas sp. StFLB209]